MKRVGAAAAIIISLVSSPALAKPAAPPSVWTGCGENAVSGASKFWVGPTAARYLTPKATPAEGIERCSAALEALGADAPWQRRAALLRSRAKFRVAAKQHREAIADLDAIAAIEQPDSIYTRSFGVSIHMLRAIAHLEAGQRDKAASEAFQAMRLRPWSERVAQFAYAVSMLRESIPTDEGARWGNLARLDNAFPERRATLFARAFEWSAALGDWQQSKPGPGEISQTYVQLPNVVVRGAPGIPVRGVDVGRTMNAVITAAMAGRPDLADGWLEKLRGNIHRQAAPDPLAQRLGAILDPRVQDTELARWGALIQAAKAAGHGELDYAANQLEAIRELPVSDVSIAVVRSIVARLPEQSHARLRSTLVQIEEQWALDRNEQFVRRFQPAVLLADIPDHEEVMLSNPYTNAVKFLRANGFSVKVAKDGRTADISFFGNKSQPFAIGEMALLRAAELAVERGQSAFRIVSSNDYAQTSTMTMYGVEVGPTTVSGLGTRMSIEFVDPGSQGAINAAEVRLSLGPIYIAPSQAGVS